MIEKKMLTGRSRFQLVQFLAKFVENDADRFRRADFLE